MKIDNLLIEDSDIEIAQDICKTIDEAKIRNRAMSNVLASHIALKFFEGEGLELDTVSGLHNVGKVLEDIDIADIYLKGSYIDIRTYFDDDKIFIPKAHFDNNLLPIAYMFIKISSDISSASVGGFILPENVDTQNEENGFYKVDENKLMSFYDIEPSVTTVEDSYSVNEEEIYLYLDNKLNNKVEFYSKLISSKDARMKLISFAKAQYIFNFVSLASETETLFANNSDNFEFAISDENLLLEENSTLDLESNSTDLLQENLSEGNLEAFDELNALDSLVETNEADVININEGIDSYTTIEADDNLLNSLNSEDEIIESNVESLDINNTHESEDTVLELSTNSTDFNFETTVTPSIQEFETKEENVEKEDISTTTPDITDSVFAHTIEFSEENDDAIIADNSVIENEDTNAQAQIDTLFNSVDYETEADKKDIPEVSDNTATTELSKRTTPLKPLLLVLLLLLIGGGAYLGYNKFMGTSTVEDTQILPDSGLDQNNVVGNAQQEDVMPVESISQQENSVSDEGNSVAIPVIEQNLDASIIVSNLSVAWEVPAGYVSNTAASRFLTKLGKIIQLNLKTELLLLSKPPITNKISVEVKFNNSTKKFETVGIVTSSGEKSVDDLILQTVNRVLAMNLKINTDSFGKLQGNPVLIIKL